MKKHTITGATVNVVPYSDDQTELVIIDATRAEVVTVGPIDHALVHRFKGSDALLKAGRYVSEVGA